MADTGRSDEEDRFILLGVSHALRALVTLHYDLEKGSVIKYPKSAS